MISVELVLWLLTVHFIADFLLQSDWMAVNKSKNLTALTAHILVYSLCLIPFGFMFALVNGFAHMLTDMVSSRVTTKLWLANQRHWFFVVIGLDQLAHTAMLIGTYNLI